jgi:soluble lytic murein transglycosylase-like protein
VLSLLSKEARRVRKLRNAITYYSHFHKIDPDLIASIIYCESRGEPRAYRFEPGFFERYIQGKPVGDIPGYWPPQNLVSRETEAMARSTSWGVMQVMGQVAREHGYRGDYLHELTDIRESIKYGTEKLGKCLKRSGNLREAIARYNGDIHSEAAQKYAQKVLAVLNTKQFQAIWEEK